MKIDGGCHCGYISYEAEIDAEKVVICHCTDCQTLSGSAFRTVALTRENAFRLLSGEPKIYVKTGESGTRRVQSFCPECGTPIYSSTIGDGPKVYGSVWGLRGNAISSCRKRSSGAARRSGGLPILGQLSRLKRSLRSIEAAGCLEDDSGRGRSARDGSLFADQRAKRLDFRPHEIREGSHPRGLLHVAVHEQIVRCRKVDVVDHPHKICLVIALKGEQCREPRARLYGHDKPRPIIAAGTDRGTWRHRLQPARPGVVRN